MKKLFLSIIAMLLLHNVVAQTARVQIIHNSADLAATEVDVYLDGVLTLDDFAFRTATPYIDFPADVSVDIDIAPGNSVDVGDSLATFPVTLADGETYVVVADGIVSGSGYDPLTPFNLEVYDMGREAALDPLKTDVLVHHGSTDAPTVDIAEVGVGAGTIVDDISYSEFQGYLDLPNNDYRIEVQDATGTVTVASYEAPLMSLGLDGEAIVAVASGFLDPSVNSDGPAFGIWVALAAGGPLVELPASTARVQVIHNSADAAAAVVDVYVDGALAIDDFAFRTATPFIDLPAGVTTEIAVAPGNSNDVGDAIATFPFDLIANETYVVVADGIVSGSGYDPATPFNLEVYDMGQEAANVGTNTDVLVHHGATDAPTVDVSETGVGAGLLVDDISYSEFQGYLELPTADYTLAVTDATGTVLVDEYLAPLSGLGLDGAALVTVASGFLNPANNSDGPAFGLWVALPAGGPLVELPEVPRARVQVIHNSADEAAAVVDIYVDGALALDDVAFRTASPFLDFPAEVEVEIAVAPGNSTSVGDAIATFPFTLANNETYVVVADGIVSPTGYDPAQPFTLEVLAGARETSLDPTKVDVQIHHGATDAPTVDIYETGIGIGLIANNLSYTDFRNSYLELPNLDYSIEVRDETGTVTVAAYELPLPALGIAGSAVTAVASGFLDPSMNSDGEAFGLWVALPTGGDLIPLPTSIARAQVIHNSADAAAEVVDVYINDDLAIDDFTFRTATPFIDLPAGVTINIAVAPGNSTSVGDAIATFPFALAANETYIVVADGIVSGSGYDPAQPFTLEAYATGREAASDASNTDVLVHHGSTDAPTVDVVEVGVGAGTIVDDISYTEFQGYLELPTADYRLEVRDASGAVTVASYEAPLATLGLDGEALVALASGFLDPSQNSDGAPFGIWVALPAGGDLIELPATPKARVQVIHNSADAAAAEVDVYIAGALAVDNFAFRTATPFINFTAEEEVEIAIAPANSTSVGDAIATFPVTLAQDNTYIVVADGIVSPTGYDPAQPFGLQVYDMGREVASDAANTDVLVHHGSTDAPTVDVVEVGVGAGTIVDDISYTEFQGYLELPTADYEVDVRDETGTVTVASYGAPLSTLGLGGAAITVVASGFLNPANNSDGAAFGLWVALAAGGDLIPLPDLSLSTTDFNVDSIALYPNPTSEILNIRGASIADYTVSIIDMQGRTINTSEISTTEASIDVSSINAGIYQVVFFEDNKAVGTKRFIKQ